MTRNMKIAGAAALALVAGLAGIAVAQSSPALSQALVAGQIGEQADGYLGFKVEPGATLRDEVDAINIKRRAAYTQIATTRGVTIKEVAAAIGCETLATRVAQGRAYQLPDGVWRLKGAAPIQLPAYCAQ